MPESKGPLYRWDSTSKELVEVSLPDPPKPTLRDTIEKIDQRVASAFRMPPAVVRPGQYVWAYNPYTKDFSEEWDEDGPQPKYGTYATRRAAQIGTLRDELEVAGGVLNPKATNILIDLLEELSKGN